jgi:phage/plasmid-like protein (TIGR03299 family)
VAHIDESTGRPAFAYAGAIKPWHGLGIQVPALMTTKEAIVAGGLDWYVDRLEMEIPEEIVVNPDGSMGTRKKITVPDRFAMVRRDTQAVLGVVGAGYTEVQNDKAFAFFDHALGEGAAVIETVGALGKGERIFAMAKCPKTVEVKPGDPVESYLLLTSTHDGTGAIKVLFTPVRVVCQNTLSAALRRSRNVISVKHTLNVNEGLKKAKELLTKSADYWTRATDAYKAMAAQEMNPSQVKEFLQKLFPGKRLLDEDGNPVGEDDPATRTKNMRENIERLFDGQATGSELAGKTKWGMFNAVTHFIDHERKGRNGSSAWENSVLGLGADLRQTAFDLLTV